MNKFMSKMTLHFCSKLLNSYTGVMQEPSEHSLLYFSLLDEWHWQLVGAYRRLEKTINNGR
jgi:hypothetical protein